MSTQMVTTNGRDLAPAWEQKLDLIKSTIAKGVTDAELELFLYQCKKTGLDPLARQIYLVRRRSGEEYKATIQTGIDGYRLIADRTGWYAGNDDAVFTGEQFVGAEGKEIAVPDAASVTVWKFVHGQRCPFTATARWREYFPGERSGPMWLKMPYVMLAKCAEALALRKAFPADLSGIYTDTEMAQADNEAPSFQPAQLAPVRDRGVADKARRRIDAGVRPVQPKAGSPLVITRKYEELPTAPTTTRLERLEARYITLLQEARELEIDAVPLPENADESTLTDLGVSLKEQVEEARKARAAG